MKAMHARQRREIEWAIIDKWPFQLHPSLRHLQAPEAEWFVNMTKEEHLTYISMVLNMETPAKANSDCHSGKACDLHPQPSSADTSANMQKEGPAPTNPQQTKSDFIT